MCIHNLLGLQVDFKLMYVIRIDFEKNVFTSEISQSRHVFLFAGCTIKKQLCITRLRCRSVRIYIYRID